MKGFIIDASVTASWFLADEVSDYATHVLNQMQNGASVHAPSLWVLEITNVLFNAQRRKRIDKKHRDAALESIASLPVKVCPSAILSDIKTIQEYADKYQMTAYDAEYLRVAKDLKLPLATQDGNLIAAAKREKVPILE